MTDVAVACWRLVVGFLAIYLIWGSTYLGIRFTIETIPPLISAGVRFILGGAMLYVYARTQDRSRITRPQLRNAAVTGVLLVVGGTGIVTWAEQYINSGLAALLVALMPFWMVLIEWLRPQGVKPPMPVFAGLLLGFFGIAVLIGPGEFGGGAINLIGAVAVGIATLSWASGSIYSRHVDLPNSRVLTVSVQMLIGGVVLLLAGSVSGEWIGFSVSAVSLRSILGLLYLITFGSLAFAAYAWLLKATTPAKVSTYAFVNPVVAVFLGWLLGGEEITLRTLLAAIVITGAVVILILSKSRSVRQQQPATHSCPQPAVATESK